MKYLSNFIEQKQTNLFNKLWIFFAFSDKQFNEQKKEWVDYITLWSGLICPKENVEQFIKEHSEIVSNWIQEDIKETWIQKIIERELSNHECYYTWDIEDAVDVLSDYGITREQILKVYRETYEEYESF